jgi:hypothetical protein
MKRECWGVGAGQREKRCSHREDKESDGGDARGDGGGVGVEKRRKGNSRERRRVLRRRCDRRRE